MYPSKKSFNLSFSIKAAKRITFLMSVLSLRLAKNKKGK